MTSEPSRTAGTRAIAVVKTTALLALIVLTVAVLAGAGVWHAKGGRWAVVETPSMGRAVPVGSLVIISPHELDQVHVGDIITYRPPRLNAMYTHRVIKIQADGTLQVQGDLNGTPDPYAVTQAELVGKVIAHWRGLGWLLRGIPLLLFGFLVLGGSTQRFVPQPWRSSARILGTCLVFALASLTLRPFVHPVLVNSVDDGSRLQATVVSTGLFPTRITGAPGHHVDLVSGQAGVVEVLPAAPGAPVMINAAPHLSGWWLVGVIAVSLLPLLWVLIVGLAPGTRSDQSDSVDVGAVDQQAVDQEVVDREAGDRRAVDPEAADQGPADHDLIEHIFGPEKVGV